MAESVRSEDQLNPPERSTKFANIATHEELHLNISSPIRKIKKLKSYQTKIRMTDKIFNYVD